MRHLHIPQAEELFQGSSVSWADSEYSAIKEDQR